MSHSASLLPALCHIQLNSVSALCHVTLHKGVNALCHNSSERWCNLLSHESNHKVSLLFVTLHFIKRILHYVTTVLKDGVLLLSLKGFESCTCLLSLNTLQGVVCLVSQLFNKVVPV